MFKDSKNIPKKTDYYRFASQTKILGRLAFAIALEERIVKFNEPVKNYIPQFDKNNLSVYSKENKFLLNIIDIASSLPDFSILVDNIVKSELVDPIKNNLELTVFAPTNEAFGKISSELSKLAQEDITKILLNHVTYGSILSNTLKNGQVLPTLGGDKIIVVIQNNEVMLKLPDSQNSVKVIQADINASNGIIHVIDSVIL